jgi:protein-cysteine N-palmitoyltransferase HHAT
MAFSNKLLHIFSLETLDTRLVAESKIPPKALDTNKDGLHVRESKADQVRAKASPSKWNTYEFYVYYAVFIFFIPWMIWSAVEVSLG